MPNFPFLQNDVERDEAGLPILRSAMFDEQPVEEQLMPEEQPMIVNQDIKQTPTILKTLKNEPVEQQRPVLFDTLKTPTIQPEQIDDLKEAQKSAREGQMFGNLLSGLAKISSGLGASTIAKTPAPVDTQGFEKAGALGNQLVKDIIQKREEDRKVIEDNINKKAMDPNSDISLAVSQEISKVMGKDYTGKISAYEAEKLGFNKLVKEKMEAQARAQARADMNEFKKESLQLQKDKLSSGQEISKSRQLTNIAQKVSQDMGVRTLDTAKNRAEAGINTLLTSKVVTPQILAEIESDINTILAGSSQAGLGKLEKIEFNSAERKAALARQFITGNPVDMKNTAAYKQALHILERLRDNMDNMSKNRQNSLLDKIESTNKTPFVQEGVKNYKQLLKQNKDPRMVVEEADHGLDDLGFKPE